MIATRVLHNICIERRDLYDTDNNDSDDSSDDFDSAVKAECLLDGYKLFDIARLETREGAEPHWFTTITSL